MKFIRVFSVSLFSQVVVMLMGFLNSVIITRNLDLTGRGQYALTMNLVVMLVLVLGDGINRSNTYIVSIVKNSFTRLLSNSIVAIGVLGAVLALVIFFCQDILLNHVISGLTAPLLWLVLFSVLPFVVLRSLEGLFLGLQWYYLYNVLVAAPQVLYCVFNFGLYFFIGFSPVMVMVNYMSAMMLLLVPSMMIVRKKRLSQFHPDWNIGIKSIRTGLRSSLSTISLYMLFRVDIFIINYFLGTDAAGLYSISVVLAELLQKFANTSGTVIFPKIAGEKGSLKSHQLSIKVVAFVLLVGLLFSAVIWFFGRTVIVMLFKEPYAPAIEPLRWLLPGTVIMAVGKIFLFSLWGRGFPHSTYVVPVIAFVLNTVLLLLLVPRLGLNGAALSTTISYSFFGIVMAVEYFRHLGSNRMSLSQNMMNI